MAARGSGVDFPGPFVDGDAILDVILAWCSATITRVGLPGVVEESLSKYAPSAFPRQMAHSREAAFQLTSRRRSAASGTVTKWPPSSMDFSAAAIARAILGRAQPESVICIAQVDRFKKRHISTSRPTRLSTPDVDPVPFPWRTLAAVRRHRRKSRYRSHLRSSSSSRRVGESQLSVETSGAPPYSNLVTAAATSGVLESFQAWTLVGSWPKIARAIERSCGKPVPQHRRILARTVVHPLAKQIYELPPR